MSDDIETVWYGLRFVVDKILTLSELKNMCLEELDNIVAIYDMNNTVKNAYHEYNAELAGRK